MANWIIYAAIATIIVTAGLTFILWRMNTPTGHEDARADDAGGGD